MDRVSPEAMAPLLRVEARRVVGDAQHDARVREADGGGRGHDLPRRALTLDPQAHAPGLDLEAQARVGDAGQHGSASQLELAAVVGS